MLTILELFYIQLHWWNDFFENCSIGDFSRNTGPCEIWTCRLLLFAPVAKAVLHSFLPQLGRPLRMRKWLGMFLSRLYFTGKSLITRLTLWMPRSAYEVVCSTVFILSFLKNWKEYLTALPSGSLNCHYVQLVCVLTYMLWRKVRNCR